MILKAISEKGTQWVDGITHLSVQDPNTSMPGDLPWMDFGEFNSDNDSRFWAVANWHGKMQGLYCCDPTTAIYLLDDTGNTITKLLIQEH